jgi:cell division protein FtsW (lipid II flippase)
MEEYLNNLLDQIRCKKAHAAIREELESHISDQIEDNMKAGMTREEAEKAAVCDMGDPVTTGISLDQIHRPKMARQMIVLMAVIMFAGVLIHWMMGAPVACMQTISGFCLMFFICHLDYTRIAAIAKVIAAGIILVGIYALFFGVRFGGNILVASLLWLRISMFSFLMLYVPVYGAILYSYYGEGYKGLVKAALWAVPPLFIALMMPSLTLFLILSVCMVSLLVLAVVKKWFQVKQKRVVIGAAILVLAITGILQIANAPYQMDRIRNFLAGDVESNYVTKVLKNCFSGSILIGKGVEELKTTLPDYNNSFILAYLTGTYGYIICAAVCAVLVLLIVAIFSIVFRQKNQLGMMMGFGSGMILFTNIAINLLENFGILPTSQTFLPFFSKGGSCMYVCYILMGVILSVYRYKDVYSVHLPKRKGRARLPKVRLIIE